MSLQGKKIVVLIGPEFEDLELWVPAMRLLEEGATVSMAGVAAGDVQKGKYGIPAKADLAFADLDPNDFDAVHIPGGWAPDKLRRNHLVIKFIQGMNKQKKIIGMICHAGLVGISAEIVKGQPATGSEGIKDDLINAGAYWKDVPAIRAGNLVWGRVVADIPAYCREVIQALGEA